MASGPSRLAVALYRSQASPRDARHAQVYGRNAGESASLVPFLAEEGQGEVDAFYLTEPAFVFGAITAGQEVVFDFIEAGQHLRIDVDHGASQAGRPHAGKRWRRSGASSQLDFALVEVIFEAEPSGLVTGRYSLASACWVS